MNVSQERIRVHPRAGEAETAVKSGGIPEERVGKKRAPASGRGEGTSADAGESGERERCARALAGAREETREQKRVPRSSSVNFIRNSVRPPLPPFSSPPLHIFSTSSTFHFISLPRAFRSHRSVFPSSSASRRSSSLLLPPSHNSSLCYQREVIGEESGRVREGDDAARRRRKRGGTVRRISMLTTKPS